MEAMWPPICETVTQMCGDDKVHAGNPRYSACRTITAMFDYDSI